MKLIDLIQVKGAFDVKADIENKQVGFKIVKLIKTIEPEFSFYQESMQKIVKKYAELDENGEIKYDKNGGYTILADNIKSYTKEVEDLNNVEVEAPNIKFTIEELEGVKLQIGGMYALYPFIVE